MAAVKFLARCPSSFRFRRTVYFNSLFHYSTSANRWSHAPVFSIEPHTLQVIPSPTAFYSALLHGIAHAKKRIALTSLYIGHDQHELLDSLKTALRREPKLRLFILLDYLRSTRPNKGKSLDSSTVQLFSCLVKEFPHQVSFSLFHTPLLRGIAKKYCPNRFNEAFGLMHMKSYIFDDELIISGANLNRDYFVNRQDRYYHFKHHPELSNYFFDLSNTVSSFSSSLVLSPDAECKVRDNACPSHTHLEAMNQFYDRWMSRSSVPLDTLPQRILEKNKAVIAIPLVQMGLYGIRQEETFLTRCLNAVASVGNFTLVLASPYLNFPKKYISHLFAPQRTSPHSTQLDIITAAPQANGFYGSKGISGHLPAAYTYLETLFLRHVKRFYPACLESIRIFEYNRGSGWTFHAKGVWLKQNQQQHPFMTLIGSSNLGRRSMERDLEAQLLIVSHDSHLNERMGLEVSALEQDAEQVHQDTLKHPQRKVHLWIKAVTRIIRSML